MTHKQLAWAVGSNTNLIVLLGLDFNAPPRPAFFSPFPVATQSQSLISPPYACLCPICLGSFYTICWAVHVSFLSPGPPLQHTRAQDSEEGRASFTSWSVSFPCPPQRDTKGLLGKEEASCWKPTMHFAVTTETSHRENMAIAWPPKLQI